MERIIAFFTGDINFLIGWLASIASLAISLFGLPAQIVKNWRERRGDSLSPSLVYASCCTYTLWSLYAWTKPDIDWFLAIPQSIGSVGALTLLAQMFIYRRRE